MANIFNYDSDVISEVPHSDSYHNDMDNQSVHAMQDFEQTPVVDFFNNEIHSDSNIIPYSQYLQEIQQVAVQDTSLYAQQDSMILFVIEKMSEQMIIISREKMIDSQMDDMIKEKLALKEQVDSLEQNLSKQIKEKESLLQTFIVFKNESREKENKYMANEIDLENKIKELDNIVYKVGQSAQTVHIVISSQHVAMPVIDVDETLILEEVSRSKMLAKQNDPISKEKKVNTTLINYVELNKLSEDFGKPFVPQQELLAEQAFWFHMSNPTTESSDASPVKVEAPSELSKVSLMIESLKKLKFHLAKFDSVVKTRTTPDALTEEYFENNELKVQLQDKDTTNCQLKEIIKSMRENNNEEKVNHDISELETINEELENIVAKFLFENERRCKEINHVKQVFKDQFDSIKKIRVRTKEQSDSLIAKLNLKSVKNEDLKAQIQDKVVQIVLWYLDSGCSKHMIGNRSQLMNFVSKFLGTVRFGNDQIAKIMGYGSRDTNLYTISLDDMHKTSSICLLSKASKTKSWLWHHRLSHLNFACALGKSKKPSHQPKAEDTNQEKLYLLHMDLCGPLCMESIKGKKYILVIVDDYSRFTWVKFLRLKDEPPEAIIKWIKNIQVCLNGTTRNVRTNNGTEFVNQTLRDFYENVGISHQTSVARSPQQNGIFERRN
ncbi:retrovirus-related pol polyprotein from transposon TNT 1-94 [Tanacetum coccineum]